MSGYDFAQWAGSGSQKEGLAEIYRVRQRYQELRRSNAAEPKLQEAYEAILRAETSCYLFRGDAWIPKLYAESKIARDLMNQVV